jgi:outer membrane protein assembly factor BamB
MIDSPLLHVSSRCCLLFACLVAAAPTAWSQFDSRFQTEDVFMLAPRSLQRLLTEGTTAIEEGRFSDGVAALGAILQEDSPEITEDLRGQDFFLTRPVRGNYTQSIKGAAIEQLNRLPPEGRRVLELQFGVKASQLLKEAVESRDLQAIGEVARRYIHTSAGYDAMAIIAQWKLNEGFPLVAADVLQSLLDYPAARQRFGVKLAGVAAMAWLQAGNKTRAASTLKLAARDFPGQSLTIKGRQWPVEDWQGILSTLESGANDAWTDKTASDWMTAGGSPARNATSNVGLPLPNERWEWFIHSSRPEGIALREMEEQLQKNDSTILPKLELRTVDQTVISRSNDSSLVGIDLRTGMLVWRRSSIGGVAPLKRLAWESGEKALSNELLGRVWGSTAFGRISCDSQRCYHVVQGESEVEASRGMIAESSNRLEGISIARQGAIIWSVGGENGDEPTLAEGYFLGPPLPYGGQLYCLVEINGEVVLAVLDPETGKLQWQQQLATAPMVSVKLDRSRQSQGLTPSIADGVIVCPTGIGGVVAVDLLTRSLRWGAVYPVVGHGRAGMGFPGGVFGSVEYDPLQNRWHDEALVVDRGIIAFTPPESDLLLCFDLLSGEQLHSRKRGRAIYIAGIDGSRLVIVYPSSVLAFDIESKHTQWEAIFPEGLRLAGKGVWQDGSLLLPLTDRQLVQIDLKTGKITDQTSVAQPLGNLFAHQGQLLSVGPTSITAYHTRSELQRQVEERLSQNPEDIWALNHQSQLLLSDGKTMEALQKLLAAYEKNPEDDDTRYFLADTMLVGLKEDFSRFLPFADRLDPVVQSTPQQWLQYLQLLAQGNMEQGDHLAAFSRLWELIKERHAAFVAGALFRPSEVVLSDRHRVDLDSWLSTELGRCYDACSASEQEEIDRAVAAEMERLGGTIQPVRRQLLRYLAHVSVANEQNFQLAEALLSRGEQTSAEQILGWLNAGSDPETRQLATEWLRRPVESDSGLAAALDASALQQRWKTGVVMHEPADEAIYSIGRPIDVISERFGRPDLSIAVSDRSLALSDLDGNPIYNLAFRQATSDLTGTFMRAEVYGGLILVETVSELLAFDFYRGFERDAGQSLLWRYSFDDTAPQETFQQPAHMLLSNDEPLGIQIQLRKSENRKFAAVGPLTASVKVVQSGGTLIGLDPYSGRKIWSREGYLDNVRLSGSPDQHELIVVTPLKGEIEWIDSRDGRKIRTSDYLVKEMQDRIEDKSLNPWNHWFSYRDWQVDYRVEETSSNVMLRVWNPREQKILFEKYFPKNARVTRGSGHLLAAVDPGGKVTVVDLKRQSWHEHEVVADRELASASLIEFAGFAVILNNRTANSQRLLPAQSDVLANGFAYGINLETQEFAWSTAGRLTNMAVPLLQPRNSPYMVAYQSIPQRTGGMLTSLILLDVRTGEIVDTISELGGREAKSFAMRLRPERDQIAVALGERNFKFQITDLDRPPEPVVYYGTGFSRTNAIIRDESSLFQ